MASSSTDLCILCKETFDDKPTVVYEKGFNTLIRISEEKNFEELFQDLKKFKALGSPIFIHTDCRKKFTDTRRSTSIENPRKKLRSSLENAFNWKTKCFLCESNIDQRHPERENFIRAMTLELRGNIIKQGEKRNDKWGEAVKGRLESCNDLVAEEAIYHKDCMRKFQFAPVTEKGRPVDRGMSHGFELVCRWMEEEGDSELYTVKDLQEKIRKLGKEPYTAQYLKTKLKERYGDHVYFAEYCGRADVVCFRDFANFIINKRKKKQGETKEDIIKAAASIIKAEIRQISKSKQEYPSTNDIKDVEKALEWVPESLQLLLKCLIPNQRQQISLGQCVTQAARPRSILCPIPFGLGVQIEKVFGSKWVVNHLYKLGFSITSYEVQRFKQSAISQSNIQEDINLGETVFVQWAADNVDHNTITLTGKGTFHGMGIVSMSEKDYLSTPVKIKRLSQQYKSQDFAGNFGVPIHQYHSVSYNGLAKLTLSPVLKLRQPSILPNELTYNFLWHLSRTFRNSSKLIPNWSGFMQDLTSSEEPKEKASISFLPIIDLNPNDEHCIYSTLLFIADQAKKLNIVTPCVTFDQPLWLKATGIITDTNMSMVARLGGFHTVMSFLGSIGKLMKGSGLEELFAEVYAEGSVESMIYGKAVSRALRAHFLVESALMSILLKKTYYFNSDDVIVTPS